MKCKFLFLLLFLFLFLSEQDSNDDIKNRKKSVHSFLLVNIKYLHNASFGGILPVAPIARC